MAGGHTVYYVAASYFIDHGGYFQYILYKEWEEADSQSGVAIITWSISHWIVYLICPEYMETVFDSYIWAFVT